MILIIFVFFFPVLVHSFMKADALSYSCSLFNSSPSRADDLSWYKAKELKQILQLCNINTKALFDKKELENALLKELEKWSAEKRACVQSIPLHSVQYGTPPKDYTAIDIELNHLNQRFIVDTGSSINILKSSVFRALPPNEIHSSPTYSKGTGGGGVVPSSSEIKLLSIQLSKTNLSYKMPFVLLENMQYFPPDVAGILGINFLENVVIGNGNGICFNYQNSLFEFGSIERLMSPLQRWNNKKIKITRIPSNLLTCNVYLTSKLTSQTVLCQGLIDLGSASTIINIPTVKALHEDPVSLPPSPLTCIGVDNRPMRVRVFTIFSYSYTVFNNLSVLHVNR